MAAPRFALVYALLKRDTGRCFYVGQTVDLKHRLIPLRSDRRYNPETDFYGVLEEEIALGSILAREQHWIAHFKSNGHPLENLNPGYRANSVTTGKNFFLVMRGEWYDDVNALCAATGIAKSHVKGAIRACEKSGLPEPIQSYLGDDRSDWLVDLRHCPNWTYSPAYQI